MSNRTPEERAEDITQAVEAFVVRAQAHGVQLSQIAHEVVATIQQIGSTPAVRLKLYAQFMQRVREQLGIQKPGRKKKGGGSTQH